MQHTESPRRATVRPEWETVVGEDRGQSHPEIMRLLPVPVIVLLL